MKVLLLLLLGLGRLLAQTVQIDMVDSRVYEGGFESLKITGSAKLPSGVALFVSEAKDNDHKYIQVDIFGADGAPAGKATLLKRGRFEDSGIEKIIPTADGGFLMAGVLEVATYKNRLWLLKYDRNFRREWSRKFATAYGRHVGALLQDTDGGYLLASTRHVRGLKHGDLDMELMKLSSRGKLLWSRHYGNRDSERPTDLVLVADGGYAVCGWSTGSGSGNTSYYGWVYRIDRRGKVVWKRGFRSKEDRSFQAIGPGGQNGYKLIGRRSFSEKEKRITTVEVLHIDRNGRQIEERSYRDPQGDLLISSIQKLPDSSLLLTGSIQYADSEGYFHSIGYVTQFDKDGVPLWFKKVPRQEKVSELQGVVPLGDGEYLAMGTVQKKSKVSKWVVRLKRKASQP